jgi:hypothetical protein
MATFDSTWRAASATGAPRRWAHWGGHADAASEDANLSPNKAAVVVAKIVAQLTKTKPA